MEDHANDDSVQSNAQGYRVHNEIISPDNPAYAVLDDMMLKARYLYNTANYEMRQEFFHPLKKMSSVNTMKKEYAKRKKPEYAALPSKVAREVMLGLGKDWRSFFKLKKNGVQKARPPKYHRGAERKMITFASDAITKKGISKKMLTVSTVDIPIIPLPVAHSRIKCVRMLPWHNKTIKVEVVYTKRSTPQKRPSSEKIAGLDLGVNNFATVSIDDKDIPPLIVDGSEVKSYNQWANKQSSRLKSEGARRGAVRRVWDKRNRRVDSFIHSASKLIVDYLIAGGVTELAVGWNSSFKSEKLSADNPGLGKRNNQNFRSLPLRKFLNVLRYKVEDAGIRYTEVEESYTSKTCVLAGELPMEQEVYSFTRRHRGLLVSKKNNSVSINADVNGGCQIARKSKPEAFSWAEGLAGKAGLFSPIKVKVAGGSPCSLPKSFLR